jgi:hypothetical protein
MGSLERLVFKHAEAPTFFFWAVGFVVLAMVKNAVVGLENKDHLII